MSLSSKKGSSALRVHVNEDDDDCKYTDIFLNDQYYESTSYLQLIPKENPKWINAPLCISCEDDKFTASFMDFTPSTTNNAHPHFAQISSAVQLFKEWNALPTTSSTNHDSSVLMKAWKRHSTIKRNDINVSIFTMDNGSITKTQSVFPYSSPVLCGIFCNNEHYAAIDENIISCKILDQMDEHSYTVFAECNRPFPFSKNPALQMIRFCYVLPNGRVLFGETSVDGGIFEADDRTVRAQITNIWHIEPVLNQYDRNGNGNGKGHGHGNGTHSLVTHYCRYTPNVQFVHRKLEEKVIVDKGKHLWKLHRYLSEVRKLLHVEGQLYIPTLLLELMEMDADSLSVSSGECQVDLVSGSPSVTADNDHSIVDLNLAVKTAIVDVKQLFKRIKLTK